jgi:hypothetical protein
MLPISWGTQNGQRVRGGKHSQVGEAAPAFGAQAGGKGGHEKLLGRAGTSVLMISQ